MPQGTDANEVRGGKVAKGVNFTFSLEDLENLPDRYWGGTARAWTKEEDEALLKYWQAKKKRDIAKCFHRTEASLRDRYKELTREG